MSQSPETIRGILNVYIGTNLRELTDLSEGAIETMIDSALEEIRAVMCAELVPTEVIVQGTGTWAWNQARATMLRNIEEKCR